MPSIFTRIIKGEIPCFKIAEDDNFFAFLDINPIAQGHTLVVSKREVDYIFDLDDELLEEYLKFCKPIAKAIKSVIPCKRIGITVIGDEVPHTHIHLIPFNTLNDMNFQKEKLDLTDKELENIASRIRDTVR